MFQETGANTELCEEVCVGCSWERRSCWRGASGVGGRTGPTAVQASAVVAQGAVELGGPSVPQMGQDGWDFCQQGIGCISLPRERPELGQSRCPKLLTAAWEGLSGEPSTANSPGNQGTECVSPDWGLGI